MSGERFSLALWEPFSPELMQETFAYDPATGDIRWRQTGKGRHAHKEGLVGFRKGGSDYLAVKFHRKRLMLHRLAWCLYHGEWPGDRIDHINGNPADNRIVNLRLADARINAENQRRARADSSTGLLGVHPRKGRYIATIRSKGRQYHGGTYATPEDAYQAYVDLKRRIHEGCSL